MNRQTDDEFAEWLRDGPEMGPLDGLERTLAATRRMGQRPGWTIPERWIPMQSTMSRTPSSRPLLLLATVGLLLIVLATAVLLTGSAQPLPKPFGLARNGFIAFARDGDLIAADSLHEARRVLVGGSTDDAAPMFSPQGDKLAFTRRTSDGDSLMMANADGTDARSIAGPLSGMDTIRWSPDGSEVIIGFRQNGYPRLAIARTDGSGSRTLDLGTPADLASWRPNGRQLVFRGQPGDGTQAAAVYLADEDGSNARRLDIGGSTTSVRDFDGLAWSPDGQHLIYMRDGDGLEWQIHIVDVDDTGNVLADRPMRFVPDSTAEALPVWSPDGSRIAFVIERDGQGQVAVADALGRGDVIPVGPSAPIGTANFDHRWSPDGGTLVVAQFIGASEASGEVKLWAVDVETGSQRRVEDQPSDLLAWQRLAP